MLCSDIVAPTDAHIIDGPLIRPGHAHDGGAEFVDAQQSGARDPGNQPHTLPDCRLRYAIECHALRVSRSEKWCRQLR
jgi:hypothetical protein